MNRQQKEAVIAEFKDFLGRSQATFLVKYKGLTVKQLQNFRKDLREESGVFKVTKARLMKIATKDIEGASEFSDQLKDQVGLIFALEEAPAVAKKIKDFAKGNEALEIIAGYFESGTLSKEQVVSLASFPSRSVLLARLVFALPFPVSGLAHSLKEVSAKLAYALDAVAKKKGESK